MRTVASSLGLDGDRGANYPLLPLAAQGTEACSVTVRAGDALAPWGDGPMAVSVSTLPGAARHGRRPGDID